MLHTARRVAAAAVLSAGVLFAAPSWARVDDVPYLDNETIGLCRAVAQAADGPVDVFEEELWGLDALDQLLRGGDAMSPERYLVAFSGYAVAHAAMHTPAYFEPNRQALDLFIQKMLLHVSWDDWLMDWGGTSPLGPDNIMYTGHLLLMITLQRQLFDDPTYDEPFVLSMPDGPVFTTSADELASSLAQQADDYLDAAADHTYGIACEPGRIFVPCNTPHRLATILHDRLHGTQHADSNPVWVDWVQQRMVDDETGVLYDLYWPFGNGQGEPGPGAVPAREDRLSGMYNGWSLWFLHGIDEAWSNDMYESYRAYFVTTDEVTGMTIVSDRTGGDGLLARGLNLASTGFGMVVAGLFGDAPLQQELLASWDDAFGAAQWDAEGRAYSHSGSMFPRLIPDAFHLLARTVTPETNWVTNASEQNAFDPTAPRVRRLTNEAAFVNQAFYDADAQRLIVTVNGGAATTEPTDIVVTNVDSGSNLFVTRNGEPFDAVRWDGGDLVVTTPPLTDAEESYVISPEVPDEPDASPGPRDASAGDAGDSPGASSGCGCAAAGTPARGLGAVAAVVMALLVSGARRRRQR